VIGAGPTGLLLAQLIGSGGATSVTVADIVSFKLRTAAALGVDSTVSITRDAAENIDLLRDASPGGDGFDVVVEATGVPAVGNICVPLVRDGGTVLIYGVTRPDERLSISPFELFRREITIKGSYAEMTSFGAAVAALRTGRVRTDGIISHRFSLDDYGNALHALASDPSAHKVVIDVAGATSPEPLRQQDRACHGNSEAVGDRGGVPLAEARAPYLCARKKIDDRHPSRHHDECASVAAV
jgi:D-arabinitol dehydrogenase (NADP+)